MSGRPDPKPEKIVKVKKQLRRTLLKKTRGNTTKGKKVQQSAQDYEFYTEITETTDHVCVYCDEPLYGKLSNFNCDHVFEKSDFPHLRHVKEDIVLTCLDCHQAKTAHRYTDRMKSIMFETAITLIMMGLLEQIGEPDYYSVKNWLIKPLKAYFQR